MYFLLSVFPHRKARWGDKDRDVFCYLPNYSWVIFLNFKSDPPTLVLKILWWVPTETIKHSKQLNTVCEVLHSLPFAHITILISQHNASSFPVSTPWEFPSQVPLLGTLPQLELLPGWFLLITWVLNATFSGLLCPPFLKQLVYPCLQALTYYPGFSTFKLYLKFVSCMSVCMLLINVFIHLHPGDCKLLVG